MKFEDLIETGHKRQSVSYDPYHGKPDDYYSSDDHHNHNQNNIQQQVLQKLKENPALKALLTMLGIVVIIALIIAIVMYFPQIIKLAVFIYEKGLSGVIDYVLNSIK